MEGRIREFTPEGIIKVFHFFLEEDKLDTYWFENVFISLFKNNQYTYNAKQIGQIFRFMLILNHEVIIPLQRKTKGCMTICI